MTKQITTNVIEDKPEFEILTAEIEGLYTQAKASCVDQDTVLKTDCIKMISQVGLLPSNKSELSKYSETSKLWTNKAYLQMLGVARELVEADSTGS